ncbi:hypothetical protein JRI60_30615 [Archangium violaceum]|nr:hypothetical protein [Archangium violaceum]QRN93524.1 hypothetical protein JRI60_30615 [Archangium violaceum]
MSTPASPNPGKLVCSVGVSLEQIIKLREDLQALTRVIHAPGEVSCER